MCTATALLYLYISNTVVNVLDFPVYKVTPFRIGTASINEFLTR